MGELLRLRQVIAKTTLSRSKIYGMMKEGTFPKSYNLGGRMVAWKVSDIDEWMMNLAITTFPSQDT